MGEIQLTLLTMACSVEERNIGDIFKTTIEN